MLAPWKRILGGCWNLVCFWSVWILSACFYGAVFYMIFGYY